MGEFSILTNARRAVIALIHSIVFLCVASLQMIAASPVLGMSTPAPISAGLWIFFSIYLVVSGILLWLFARARGWIEKSYFALCTVSAASGLLRTIVGDHAFPSAQYIRVIMLTCAVVLCTAIVRIQSQIVEATSLADEE
jgi:hypothetical protein